MKTIAFKLDIEQSTPLPDQCVLLTFLGRAEIDTETNFRTTRITITDLWLGIDVDQAKMNLDDFRSVHIPDNDFLPVLESAALHQFNDPVPVTLPDEVQPLALERKPFFGIPFDGFEVPPFCG